MPYYIFKLDSAKQNDSEQKQLELIAEFSVFKEASQFAKQQRAEQLAEDSSVIKLMFGENQPDAIQKLSEKREPQPRDGD